MRYCGGKFKQAKTWAPLILARSTNRHSYIEPFVGGANFLEHMAPHFTNVIAADLHPDLILLWKHIQVGSELPDSITRDQFLALRAETEPSALRGAVLFGGSFAGRFGCVNQNVDERYQQAKRGWAKTAPRIRNVDFRTCDFAQLAGCASAGSVVYCDPPYASFSEKGYHRFSNMTKFHSVAFWDEMRKWRSLGADVYVSEYEAPSDWTCISELSLPLTISSNRSIGDKHVDRLFV